MKESFDGEKTALTCDEGCHQVVLAGRIPSNPDLRMEYEKLAQYHIDKVHRHLECCQGYGITTVEQDDAFHERIRLHQREQAREKLERLKEASVA